MRVLSFLPLAGILALTLAGCGGTNSMSSAASPSGQSVAPMVIDFNGAGLITKAVGVRLTNEKTLNSKVYGKLLGYFNGSKSTTTQVVVIKVGSKVVFHSVDGGHQHTASFLGDASKTGANFPKSFNGSSTQSPAGTDISTANFSTGTLNPNTNSLVYAANTPGYYMFGCAFHYGLFGMRDIIVVQ